MKVICFDCANCSDLILKESHLHCGKVVSCPFIVCNYGGKAGIDLIPRLECPHFKHKKVKTCFNCQFFVKRTDDHGGWCLEYTNTLSYNDCYRACRAFEVKKE